MRGTLRPTSHLFRQLGAAAGLLVAMIVLPGNAQAVGSGASAHARPHAASPVAQVRYIHGGLGIQPGHGAFHPAAVGNSVFNQYGAQTQANQKASFHFADGTALKLNELTTVIFRSPNETDLTRGEIAQYLTPGTSHRLVTQAATAAAIGTTFDVRISGDDAIFVVLEGALMVSNAQGQVLVKNNLETTVGPGQVPTPPSYVNALAVFDWTASIPTPDLGRDIGLDANGGKVVHFSSQAASATGTWDAIHINDGLLSEGWESADGQSTNQWVKLRFYGRTQFRISGVVIDPAATHGDPATEDLKDFQIRVSTTGTANSDFVTVLTGACRQAAVLQRFNLPAPVAARYVELYMLDNYGSPRRVAVAEFEVVATTTSLNFPTGLTLDTKGNLYVADTGNQRLQEISPHGKVLKIWGGKGTTAGKFLSPYGVAVDTHGHIFVADTFNRRIQEFSSPGHFQRILGTPSDLVSPTTVAVDSQDNLFVGDTGGHRIDRFSPSGQPLAPWIISGSATTCTSPGGLAVDSAGNVYDQYYAVAAGGRFNIRIEKRAPNGLVLATWTLPDLTVSCFSSGLAVDSNGDIWVSLTEANQIEELSPHGQELARWGSEGLSPGHFIQPIGIAIGRQGAVLVVDSGNSRIQKLTRTGKSLAQWGKYGTVPQVLGSDPGIAVDSHGTIYVSDFVNNRIQVRAPDGTVTAILGHIGRPVVGRGPSTVPLGQFDRPWGVAVDSQGAIYVADVAGEQVQKLAPRGPIAAFGGLNGAPPGFNMPYDVAVDGAGNIYVADTGNSRIVKLAPNGTVLATWGSRGSAAGQFNDPFGIAVDTAGNVYVADTGNNRIEKISPSGTVLAVFGKAGIGPGEFEGPDALAVSQAGNIYVTEGGNERVQELAPDGSPIAQWSQTSTGLSLFFLPLGIAVDSQGNVYVADTGNVRIVKLNPDGTVAAIWN